MADHVTSLPTSPEADPSPGRPSNSLVFKVGEMSGKLDQILLQVAPALSALSLRVDKVEEVQAGFVPRGELVEEFRRRDERLTTLEALRWQAIGIISAGGVLWWVLLNGHHLVSLLQVTPT